MKPLLNGGPASKAAGCIILLIALAIEALVGLGLTVTVGDWVVTKLGARDLGSSSGTDFWIGLAAGLAVAAGPVFLLDRAARRVTGYSPLGALGELGHLP